MLKHPNLYTQYNGWNSCFTYKRSLGDNGYIFQGMWGLDMRRGMDPAVELHGRYSTDLFTDEAVRVIQDHNISEPLFLYLSHAAVHSGNPYNLLPAPDSLIATFRNITDYNRKRFAGTTLKLWFFSHYILAGYSLYQQEYWLMLRFTI